MDVPTFRRVLRTLIERYTPKNWAAQMDPFEALIAIIVSQNSTDLVTERVMKELASRVKVTPETIAKMPDAKLVAILRPLARLSDEGVARLGSSTGGGARRRVVGCPGASCPHERNKDQRAGTSEEA